MFHIAYMDEKLRGPLYIIPRNYDHVEMLRAIKMHPKAIPWKLKNHFTFQPQNLPFCLRF
jgi:hypothetical protein